LGVVSASEGNALRDGYAREVFRQAAGVIDQHSDSDRVTTLSGYQPQQVAADRRIEPDLPALHLLQDRGGGEGLGDAADSVPHVGGNRTTAADIGDAGGATPYLIAVTHLGEHSRDTRMMYLVYGALQFRPIE